MTTNLKRFTFMGLGQYPEEYVRKIHGPYDAARYYGKPDVPLGQVKVGELPGWLARRSFNPWNICRALGRTWWRWNNKYVFVRYGTFAPIVQFCVMSSIVFYCFNYKTIRYHSQAKYH